MQERWGAGDLPGLENSLAEAMRNYVPAPAGVCFIADLIGVNLPHDLWAWWSWVELMTTGTVGAGLGTPQTLLTVPGDERAELEHVDCRRSVGDNTIERLYVLPPDGYRTDANSELNLLTFTTDPADCFWPDPASDQALSRYYSPNRPLLLEPGSLVVVEPTGAGAVGTAWECTLLLRRTHLTRASFPNL